MERPPTMAVLTTAPSLLFVAAAGDATAPGETPTALLVIAGILLVALTTAGFVALFRERREGRSLAGDEEVGEKDAGATSIVLDLRGARIPAMGRHLPRNEVRLTDPWTGSDRQSNRTAGRLRDPWQPAGDPVATGSELCAIDGIGTALARRLTALGVACLADLASLDEDATAELRDGLGRYGRMLDRYDWVGQAQRLRSSSEV